MEPDTLFRAIPDTSFAIDTSWLAFPPDTAYAQAIADSVRVSDFGAMLWTYCAVAVVVLVYGMLAMARDWKGDEEGGRNGTQQK